ncbi:MAG TPA: type II toxin-antitoxin system VapC family toxin [Bryobacteraceae bacterium]|nr:type II toxin-antitoxin system VapC family toxin [Bryobacteraceae bacterium]
MALYYLETSALVKLYVRETGSARLLRLAARINNHRFAVLVLARVEFHSAIRRRQREGDVDAQLAKHLLDQFEQHMESKFIKQLMNDALIDVATGLVDRHALRAYDAVQLAGCIALKANAAGDEPIFVCSDRRLVEAAEAEGLSSLDPTVQ